MSGAGDQAPGMRQVGLDRIDAGGRHREEDVVAVEEPLEIRLGFRDAAGKRCDEPVSITMRTPGADAELALGFLYGEGIITGTGDVAHASHVAPPAPGGEFANVLRVDLARGVLPDLERLARHFYTTSSCGVCGKGSLEALAVQRPRGLPADGFRIDAADLAALPARLAAGQTLFDATGGIHAAATFTAAGEIARSREDVGRHNALDKLVGSYLRDDSLPLTALGVLVSGRASFELVQKAVMAGSPMLAAVGAPSSLAIELAGEFGVTLVGFLREGRMNVYAGGQRLS